jgi:uncharacterized membrane protein YkvA (DUF1232 family)
MDSSFRKFFTLSQSKGVQVLSSPVRLAMLIGQSVALLGSSRARKSNLLQWKEKLSTALRLLSAWKKGTYKEVPKKSIIWLAGALVYFISPADMVPDIIPVLGLADDATIIAWVLTAMTKDLTAFEHWEKSITPSY